MNFNRQFKYRDFKPSSTPSVTYVMVPDLSFRVRVAYFGHTDAHIRKIFTHTLTEDFLHGQAHTADFSHGRTRTHFASRRTRNDKSGWYLS